MLFPDYRPRRMRRNTAFRRMIRETVLGTDDLILPLFAIDGKGVRDPIHAGTLSPFHRPIGKNRPRSPGAGDTSHNAFWYS